MTEQEENEFHKAWDKLCDDGYRSAYEAARHCWYTAKRSQPVVEAIEQAHMAGQSDAGVDPSYSNAKEYANRIKGDYKMTEPIEKWREEFEGFCSHAFIGRLDNGNYQWDFISERWCGFLMAKRGNCVVELPAQFHDSISGYECDELHESLTDAGIQYRIKGE